MKSRWVWQNYSDPVILLKFQSVALVEIMVKHCDFVKLSANLNMH